MTMFLNLFCRECPAAKYIKQNFEEDDDQLLAINVAQGLSGSLATAVRGTKGLTDKKIEEIRQEEMSSWHGSEEAQILESNANLAQAVYFCEEKITILGNCALHSIKQ